MSTDNIGSEGKVLPPPRKPWVAFLLGLLIFPGYGQIYNGNLKQGLTIVSVYFSVLAALIIAWAYLSTSIVLLAIILAANLTVYVTILIHGYRQCKHGGSGLPRRWYNRKIGIISVWFLTAFIIFPRYLDSVKYFVKTFKVPASSMAPTIEKGDVFFSKQAYYGLKIPFRDKLFLPIKSPQRGDIVVFKFPKDETKSFIKRVVGLPGETIEGRDKEIYVNGQKLTEPYIIHDPAANAHVPELDHFGPVTVAPGEYFVLGDNRDHSLDSRFWGPVSLNKIKGKATVIYWSWDSERGAVRWDRIGRALE